VKDIAAK